VVINLKLVSMYAEACRFDGNDLGYLERFGIVEPFFYVRDPPNADGMIP
jgi:hypothetical protein